MKLKYASVMRTLYFCEWDRLFLNQKGKVGTFTCGRDLFRISMTIDLHVWSSIAGYGSRKRCWLGDQKCGQFRMVGRAHFELLHFNSFFDFLSYHETFSNPLLMSILFHYEDFVGGFGHWLCCIRKSVVFSR